MTLGHCLCTRKQQVIANILVFKSHNIPHLVSFNIFIYFIQEKLNPTELI